VVEGAASQKKGSSSLFSNEMMLCTSVGVYGCAPREGFPKVSFLFRPNLCTHSPSALPQLPWNNFVF